MPNWELEREYLDGKISQAEYLKRRKEREAEEIQKALDLEEQLDILAALGGNNENKTIPTKEQQILIARLLVDGKKPKAIKEIMKWY